jgi:hypothetical protein
MSKAVLLKSGQSRFLMETDESVEVPAEMRVIVSAREDGIPSGMQPVVILPLCRSLHQKDR